METTGPQDDTEDQEIAKQWYDYYQAIDTHNDVIFDTEHVLQILMIKFQHFFKNLGDLKQFAEYFGVYRIIFTCLLGILRYTSENLYAMFFFLPCQNTLLYDLNT